MLGETLHRIFPPESKQLEREMAEAVTNGRGGEEGWRLRKDGSLFWATGELTPIREAEAIVGFVKILRDRSQQRAMEEDAREERRALEILNRAGSALGRETDLQRLVQIVTDAGVELTGAQFGAFFYNVLNEARRELHALHALRRAGGGLRQVPHAAQHRGVRADVQRRRDRSLGRHHEGSTLRPERASQRHARGPSAGAQLPRGARDRARWEGHRRPLLRARARSASSPSGPNAGSPGSPPKRPWRSTTSIWPRPRRAEIAERTRAQDALRDLNANLEREVAERTEAAARRTKRRFGRRRRWKPSGQLTGGVAHDFNNICCRSSSATWRSCASSVPADAGRMPTLGRTAP